MQVTDEWAYTSTPHGQNPCTGVRARLTPKYVEQRRVKLVLRTTKEVLQPQPEAAAVLHEVLAWISRVDEAAQQGKPKPPSCRFNGEPHFPTTKWWLTEMERRRPAEVAGTVDEDAQLDEENLTLDPAAAGVASSGSSSASAEDDSDASLPAGPPPPKKKRQAATGQVGVGRVGAPGSSCGAKSTAATATAAPSPATPQRDATLTRPWKRLRGKTSLQTSLHPPTQVPQPSLLERALRGEAPPAHAHIHQQGVARSRIVMGSATVPDLPADVRRSAKRGDADIEVVQDPSAASSEQ